MEVLESAMAFAVVMIVLSTIVTGIVELLLRLAGARERNLRNTVRSLFDSVVWPRMKGRLMQPGTESEKSAKKRLGDEFIKGMTQNPASELFASQDQGTEQHSLTPGRHDVGVLTPLAFAERLGRTSVGRAILSEGEQQLDLLVHDFVRTFDRFGSAASEMFRKNANLTAMVIGVLFALGANIEAGRLFTALMDNPDLRAGLIAESEITAKANQEAAASLQKVVERLDEESGVSSGVVEEIKTQAAKIDASVSALESKGLPIGHVYFPFCNAGPTGDPLCEVSSSNWSEVLKYVRWALLTILAGVLIGLGGPFWYRVFSGLSQVFQLLRAIGVRGKEHEVRPEELTAPLSAEESAKPKDVIDAFRVAADVHAQSVLTNKRVLLGPNGQPL